MCGNDNKSMWVMIEIIQIHKCTMCSYPGVLLFEKMSQVKQRKKSGEPCRFGMTLVETMSNYDFQYKCKYLEK